MLNLNKRLPAFSLAEMLVVMLLSGLATGIIYFAYYTVNRYYINLERKYTDVNDVSLFQHLVEKDFDRCEHVTLTDEGFSCTSGDSVLAARYEISNFVIRTQGSRSDTFKINPIVTQFWLERKIVHDGVIDAFYLEGVCLSDTLNLKFIKMYDASSLIRAVKKDTIW